MILKYDTQQLNKIVDDIHLLTGISISILDTSFNLITQTRQVQEYCSLVQETSTGTKLCEKCDTKILNNCSISKKLETHICHAGFYDSAMPIIKNNITAGFLIMGQVRSEASPDMPLYTPDTDEQTIKKLNSFYKKTPYLSKTKLDALHHLLPQILFDNTINIVYDELTNEAVEFIDRNLKDHLSIETLCRELHVSKNRLYDAFEKNLGCTVNAHITEQRINRAKKLLVETNSPVYAIGEMVGIDNYTYFCKLFKKHCGITPQKFRTKNLSKE